MGAGSRRRVVCHVVLQSPAAGAPLSGRLAELVLEGSLELPFGSEAQIIQQPRDAGCRVQAQLGMRQLQASVPDIVGNATLGLEQAVEAGA